ncbi:MAG: T9SS type A sorting domain-containing protein [Chitinophagaceae bacterium]
MKEIYLILTLTTIFGSRLLSQTNTFPNTGSAGIGTVTPDPSALLDMVSTSQGLLMPRLSLKQRNNIVAPANGLMIYQTNATKGFYFYNGAAWKELSPTLNGWSLTGNAATNPANNFIGTTDLQPLVFRVNNQIAGIIDKTGANTSLGYLSLISNTGNNNTANGFMSMQSNSTGYYNTASGTLALNANTTGSNNTANGSYALGNNIDGNSNTAIGAYTLASNQSGQLNTACGLQALYQNTIGNNNTACGVSALYENVGGNGNTAIGNGSLGANYYGSYNSAMGGLALGHNIFGSYNTAIGYSADVYYNNLSNSTAIGYGAIVDASNKIRFGNSSVTSIGGAVAWTTYSDFRIKKNIKENVPGLAFIKLLKPVTFNTDLQKEYDILGKYDSSVYKEKNDIEKINFTGFIAQDVQAAALKIGYDFSGLDTTGKIMGLRYSEFVVPLVKAVQELAEGNDRQIFINDSINKTLQDQLDIQEKQIAELKALVSLKSQSSGVIAKKNIPGSILRISPNPSKNQITISGLSAGAANYIELTDLNGRSLLKQKVANTYQTLDVSKYANGTYILVYFDGNKMQQIKFIKE